MTPDEDLALSTLMRAAQGGDTEAYSVLLGRVAVLLRRFVKARAPRAPWSEDMVQDALLTIHRARQTYDPTRPFGPWLYAIAEYRLQDAFRREGRHARRYVEDESAMASHPAPERGSLSGSPDAALSTDELAGKLRGALDELPGVQREVIELLKIEGLSVREVAGATGLSEANVRVIAHRGYKSLRERLKGWLR